MTMAESIKYKISLILEIKFLNPICFPFSSKKSLLSVLIKSIDDSYQQLM